jgi:carboxypeptidase D
MNEGLADVFGLTELPQYAPGAAYRILEFQLGRIESLEQEGDFTTQTGNYTGNYWP